MSKRSKYLISIRKKRGGKNKKFDFGGKLSTNFTWLKSRRRVKRKLLR